MSLEAALSAGLRTAFLGRTRRLLAETTSTMDEVRAASREGAARGFLCVADAQTAGRGTHGRAWSSDDAGDLYLSFLELPTLPIERAPMIALAVGLGVADTVRAVRSDAAVAVKWPNDVLVGGRKIAGILVESHLGTRFEVVVGVGLNVARTAFEPGLHATSLDRLGAPPADRGAVLVELLARIEGRLLELYRAPDATVAALAERLAYRDQPVSLDGARVTVRGLDGSGCLVVEDEAGAMRPVVAGRIEPLD